MSPWEFSFDWCLALARDALMENGTGEKVDAYIDWVFARHPDLCPPTDEYTGPWSWKCL